MKYSYPKTAEEYWNVVEAYWKDLENILGQFLTRADLVEASKLKMAKDKNLVEYFQKAWDNAPDAGWIHSIPSWHILCDLCSECYVLYEE